MTIHICKTTSSELYSFLTQNPGSFYVGRGRGSLGNPFRAKSKDESDVAAVVAAYRIYLNLVVNKSYEPKQAAAFCEMQYHTDISEVWWDNPPKREEMLKTLKLMARAYSIQESINLVCFCINRPWIKKKVYTECHAEVVAACVAKLMEAQ